MVSELKMKNAHTHFTNPYNNSSLSTKQKHELLAEVTQKEPSRVVPKTGQNISLRETCALTNRHSNVSGNDFYLIPIHERYIWKLQLSPL